MKCVLIASVVVLIVGLSLMVYRYAVIERSKVCWGTVVSLARTEGSESVTYSVVAKFRAHDENEYYYRSSFSTSHPGYLVGDGIRVYYNPEDPNQNGAMTFLGAYGFGFFVTVLGLISTLVTFALLFNSSIAEWMHPKFFPSPVAEVKSPRF